MGDFGPDSGGRIKGLTIIKPIVYGNIARYFGKKREEDGHTHQWTVYVKSFRNEDLSNYVKKVHFKLHESYPNQNRVVTKPPYEVTETGWGEFEVVIKIYFNDSNERPMFQDPTQMMHQLLTNVRPIMMGTYRHENDFEEKREKTVNNILNAKNKIRYEIAELNERLKQSKETILKYKNEILKMEECDDVLTQPLQCPTTSLPSSTAVSLPSATSSASTVSLNVSVDNGATTPTTVTTATTSEVPTSLSISSSATTSINTLSI
ncbi:domain-containing 4-like [Octopus vulgaris]|uniref:Domain-containing 4-like n=1 Tax=Octopus vulgaris TaxID=6645 RepID=A0AA36ARG7_OCTVU|nr:domain-containing 4-like [Octopus vulgaris]